MNERINKNSYSIKEFLFFVDEQGDKAGAIVLNYIKTLPPSERASASWTLQQIGIAENQRLVDYVKSRIPEWKHGQTFDRNIFADTSSVANGIDIKA